MSAKKLSIHFKRAAAVLFATPKTVTSLDFPNFAKALAILALLLGGLTLPQSNFAETTNEAIMIEVAEGIRRVRMDVYNQQSGEWETQQMAHTSGQAGALKMRLPSGLGPEDIRLLATENDPLPYRIYAGQVEFEPVTSYTQFASTNYDYGFVTLDTADSEANGITVEESDIWAIEGDELFFFNQLRGLQIFDIGDIKEPKRITDLRIPATGEKMFVLDQDNVILVTDAPRESRIEILYITRDGSQLNITEHFEITGSYVDSRLIENQLHVIAQTYEVSIYNGSELIEERAASVRVESFDFTAGTHPEHVSTIAFEDTINRQAVVSASGQYLFINCAKSKESSASSLKIIDAGRKAGDIPELLAEIDLPSMILDKHKVQYQDGALSVVLATYQLWGDIMLINYRVDEATGESSEIARLEIIENESLHATHFVGDRIYIVTFSQIDPLWVIDNSELESPTILGELEIPGWSTYIEPLENETLLSVGVEDGNVAVSLFDIADPTAPTMTERVYPGGREFHTWSEANYDERAIYLNQSEGLLMLPIWKFNDGAYAKQIQIVDLTNRTLSLRGTVNHDFVPRRSELLGQSIVSISGRELIVTDASDWDKPELVSETEIAWSVNSLHKNDATLIQIEESRYSNRQSSALRLTSSTDPENILAKIPLEGSHLVGFAQKDNIAYLAVHELLSDTYLFPHPEKNLQMLSYDISDPEEPQLISTISLIDGVYNFSRLKSVWLSESLLTWYSQSPYDYYIHDAESVTTDGWDAIAARDRERTLRILTIDTTTPENPQTVGDTDIGFPEHYVGRSKLFYEDARFFLTYSTEQSMAGQTQSEQFLLSIDMRDPTAPIASAAYSFALYLRTVEKITEDNFLLLGDVTYDRHDEGIYGSYFHGLYASIYDGFDLFLSDELILDKDGYHPIAFNRNQSFHAYAENDEEPREIKSYLWDVESGFTAGESWQVDQEVTDLYAVNDLLFAQSGTSLMAADISKDSITEVAEFELSDYLWYEVPIEDAVIEPNKGIWIPTGVYGVEYLDFQITDPSIQAILPTKKASTFTPDWFEIAGDGVVVTDADDPATGSINTQRDYLFIPETVTDRNAHWLFHGWKYSDWFGYYQDLALPWVFHNGLGWFYQVGNEIDGMWMWDEEIGWLWSDKGTFPFAYSSETDNWLWFLYSENMEITHYYDYSSDQWITIE